MVSFNVSCDDVPALMPHQVLTRIHEEPTYSGVNIWRRQLNADLIAIETPLVWGRGKGHLGLFQDPPATGPISYPIMPAGATTAEREALRAANELEHYHWKRYIHKQRLAVIIGAAALEP